MAYISHLHAFNMHATGKEILYQPFGIKGPVALWYLQASLLKCAADHVETHTQQSWSYQSFSLYR